MVALCSAWEWGLDLFWRLAVRVVVMFAPHTKEVGIAFMDLKSVR